MSCHPSSWRWRSGPGHVGLAHLPFNLAQCEDLQRPADALREYMAHAAHQKHRYSTDFFGPDGELNRFVSKSSADGALHPRLAERVRAVAMISLQSSEVNNHTVRFIDRFSIFDALDAFCMRVLCAYSRTLSSFENSRLWKSSACVVSESVAHVAYCSVRRRWSLLVAEGSLMWRQTLTASGVRLACLNLATTVYPWWTRRSTILDVGSSSDWWRS